MRRRTGRGSCPPPSRSVSRDTRVLAAGGGSPDGPPHLRHRPSRRLRALDRSVSNAGCLPVDPTRPDPATVRRTALRTVSRSGRPGSGGSAPPRPPPGRYSRAFSTFPCWPASATRRRWPTSPSPSGGSGRRSGGESRGCCAARTRRDDRPPDSSFDRIAAQRASGSGLHERDAVPTMVRGPVGVRQERRQTPISELASARTYIARRSEGCLLAYAWLPVTACLIRCRCRRGQRQPPSPATRISRRSKHHHARAAMISAAASKPASHRPFKPSMASPLW